MNKIHDRKNLMDEGYILVNRFGEFSSIVAKKTWHSSLIHGGRSRKLELFTSQWTWKQNKTRIGTRHKLPRPYSEDMLLSAVPHL